MRPAVNAPGGEGGIRTHDPGFSRNTAFRERGLQPLGNLSVTGRILENLGL